MGFPAIGDLTHEMENVLDDLRNGQLAVTTPIVDALLECLDALSALIARVAATGEDTGLADGDIPALVARLSALRPGGIAAPAAPNSGGAEKRLRQVLRFPSMSRPVCRTRRRRG